LTPFKACNDIDGGDDDGNHDDKDVAIKQGRRCRCGSEKDFL
jgi:hypothetical protein